MSISRFDAQAWHIYISRIETKVTDPTSGFGKRIHSPTDNGEDWLPTRRLLKDRTDLAYFVCYTVSHISRDRQDHMEYPLDQKMSYKASHGDADTNTEPPVSLQRTKPGFINTTVVLALGGVVVFAFDERKFEFQGDLVADQYTAGIQRGIPRDTPVFAIDAAGALESCT